MTTKLKAKAALSIPYDVPASGVMQVRVAGSEPINVFAIPRTALEQYKKEKTGFAAFGVSSVAREHQFLVQLPARSPWNLIIENPWEREVEVNYAAVEMTTTALPPVTVSGAVTTSSPTVTGSIHLVGPAITGTGTGTVTPPGARRGS